MNTNNFIKILEVYNGIKGEGVTMDITFGSKEDDIISVGHEWTIEVLLRDVAPMIKLERDEREKEGPIFTCFFEPSSITSIVINRD